MQTETLAEIKGYLQSVKPLFINGQIKLVSEDGIIKVTYKDSFLDFTVKEKIKADDREAIYQVALFCFSVYSDFERDGKPKTSEFLAKLLHVKAGNMRIILHRVLNKIKKHGEPILREEEEIGYVQDYQQEPSGSMIPEKHGTKFPGSEKERVEVPLW